jgi:hypothetical protein
VSFGLSLPTGATGLTRVELVPVKDAEVAVDNLTEPVALSAWLAWDQPAEINAALAEILALSIPSRFELHDGQEVHIGSGWE